MPIPKEYPFFSALQNLDPDLDIAVAIFILMRAYTPFCYQFIDGVVSFTPSCCSCRLSVSALPLLPSLGSNAWHSGAQHIIQTGRRKVFEQFEIAHGPKILITITDAISRIIALSVVTSLPRLNGDV